MRNQFAPYAQCTIFFVAFAACDAQSATPTDSTAATASSVVETSADVESLEAQSPFCTEPGWSTFDFWLGDWNLRVGTPGADANAPWVYAHGTDRIQKKYGGCVIEERFDSPDFPGGRWAGTSVSQWVPSSNQWQQTWVDNQSAYLLHYGGPDDHGQMILYSAPVTKNGAVHQHRMVFWDIQKNSIHWRWEGTKDGGQTWTSEITIDYTRRGR
ncbi:MAG TPA: hypothetical protein VNO21_03415 [Polyangiaceae bacterium]|nr:hypothetical protein [Polyangiaceae bacterium]